MSTTESPRPRSNDPLIDEVRGLRRAICEEYGNDVDRLCDHLQVIEHEYRTRTGRFADVPREVAGELFPEAAATPPDPMLDEMRALRGRS